LAYDVKLGVIIW